MTFTTLHDLSAHDLVAMANGTLENTITDMDFLETLAGWRMFVVPPWVMEALPDGGVRKVTRLVFTVDGNLDKPRILLKIGRYMKAQNTPKRFGRRFQV
jgi:hypothetical protein